MVLFIGTFGLTIQQHGCDTITHHPEMITKVDYLWNFKSYGIEITPPIVKVNLPNYLVNKKKDKFGNSNHNFSLRASASSASLLLVFTD